ncbi:hypothetical protein L9F63_003346, partial [Diploptera punctata]
VLPGYIFIIYDMDHVIRFESDFEECGETLLSANQIFLSSILCISGIWSWEVDNDSPIQEPSPQSTDLHTDHEKSCIEYWHFISGKIIVNHLTYTRHLKS